MSEEIKKDVGGRISKESVSTPQGKNYLLSIGIDKYSNFPPLYNAVKDAKDIVKILVDKFQFKKDNIIELHDTQATKQNIYNVFKKLIQKVSPKDNVLIYFSGHGEFDKILNSGYWIPVDAEKNMESQYLTNSEIKSFLVAVKSHHTFIMVDSCFSGTLFNRGTNRDISSRKERDSSRWGLTSGRNEIVSDGKPGANSPFAQSILYELKNAKEPLGVARLCDKVLEVVSSNASQTPLGEPLNLEGHLGGQFVFRPMTKGSMKKIEINNGEEDSFDNYVKPNDLTTNFNPSIEVVEYGITHKYAGGSLFKISFLIQNQDIPSFVILGCQINYIGFNEKYGKPKHMYILEGEIYTERKNIIVKGSEIQDINVFFKPPPKTFWDTQLYEIELIITFDKKRSRKIKIITITQNPNFKKELWVDRPTLPPLRVDTV